MSIVYGFYQADSGTISINGNTINLKSPRDSILSGIGMVHQHFKLIEPFTVSENLMLSCGSQLKVKSLAEIARLASSAGDKLGFKIVTDTRVGDLSVAERQRIEIIKLTLLGADILILDEPTAVLTDEESTAVLSLLRHLASQGRAVVLITHRLDEVTGYADKVTVMRAGKTVVNGSAVEGMTSARLAEAMVGNTVDFDTTKQSPKEDAERAVRLELRNLCVYRKDKSTIVDNLNLVRDTEFEENSSFIWHPHETDSIAPIPNRLISFPIERIHAVQPYVGNRVSIGMIFWNELPSIYKSSNDFGGQTNPNYNTSFDRPWEKVENQESNRKLTEDHIMGHPV